MRNENLFSEKEMFNINVLVASQFSRHCSARPCNRIISHFSPSVYEIARSRKNKKNFERRDYIIHDYCYCTIRDSIPFFILYPSSLSRLADDLSAIYVCSIRWRIEMWSEITSRKDNTSLCSNHIRWERSLHLYCLHNC